MIPHRDEILRPAVSTDATAVPRYDHVRPDGTIIEKNVAMRLANPVAREGTPISKAALDEMLAASGVTDGTATAYTLAQEEYTLFDGAPVRFRLHTASGDGATLNINGTGAKPLRDMMGAAMPGGIPAGTWLAVYYSSAAGAYVLAGGEAVRALYGERYTVDDATAYIKDVPADALPAAEIGEIGGMTYKINVGTEANPVYELRSAPVTEVKSVGLNLFDANHYNIIDGYFTHTTQAIMGASQTKTVYVRCAPNTTYTISKRASTRFAVGFSQDVPAKGVAILDAQSDTTGKITTFTSQSPDNAQYMAVWVYHADYDTLTLDEILSTLMIYRGTTALPYTPYFHDILPIPEAVRALDGYGWGISATIRNYISRKYRKFVKMVGRVDLGTLNWSRFEAGAGNTFSSAAFDIKPATNANGRRSGWICNRYDSSSITDSTILDNKSAIRHSDAPILYVRDDDYTDAASFKAAMSGVMLYYELATPIITDISSLLPADNILRVQPGGTITPVNEYGYAVPTKITYQRDVLANRASTFEVEKLRREMEGAEPPDVSGAISAAISAHKSESAAHSAASIVTDSTHRFVTDTEKAAWNAGGGGSAKIISNTRLASATASVTVNLPMEYTYLRIILSEAATTSTAFGYIRGALNVDTISTGMAVSANNSGGAEITSSTSSGYAFETHFYGNRAYGYIVLDLVRYPDAGAAKGTCFWSNDGGGDDQYAITGSLVISAGGEPTTLTISSGSGHSIKNGMGILVMGVK